MNRLDNVINTLKINPIERYERACTFDKSLMIEYCEFQYLGVEFVISASRSGYVFSLKNSATCITFRTDKALIRELKARFKEIKGGIANEEN